MGVFDEHDAEPEPSGARRLIALAVVVLVAVAGVIGWLAMRGPEEAPATAATPSAAPPPAARPATKKAEAAPGEARSAEPEPRRAARKAEAPATSPDSSASAAPATTLTIESDVPNASVFVDREFVGTAPVTLRDLAPGQKRVNVSAEGYEGVQRTVDVAAGENTVTLRFKEVRLNASVGVSHKHGMGGCEGTLKATVDGLVYDTSNKNDAFTLPYAQVEAFEVNYLEKNLRVKQRGGRTWNFTDRAAVNADKLFVFHRDVQAAREKLAKGFAAAR